MECDGLARGELLHGALVSGGRPRDGTQLGGHQHCGGEYHGELACSALALPGSSASAVGGYAHVLRCVQGTLRGECHGEAQIRDGPRGVAQLNDGRDEGKQSRKLHGMSGVHGLQREGTRRMCDVWGSRATDAPSDLVRGDQQGSLSKAHGVGHGRGLELRGTRKLLVSGELLLQGDVAQELHGVQLEGGGLLRA